MSIPEAFNHVDWRPEILIGEDLYAAPAPDGDYECRSARALLSEFREASGGRRPDANALWKAYQKKRTEMEACRDAARVTNAVTAADLARRAGKIRGVVVESAEVDDFGGIELCIVVDGTRLWTRPVKDAEKGHKTLRDAISARRRGDYQRARLWLSHETPWRRFVEWDGYEQLRFGENQYGARWWPR